jgi:hypothetical protein
MKNLTLLIFLFISLNSFSQKYSQFYVTHQNDTIECKIINFSNKKVNVFENGKRKSLKPKTIKSFSSFNGENYRTFTILKNDKKNFYEENIIGKLSYYRVYVNNSYTVMVKEDKIVYLNALNPRKRIAELISDCPSLLKEWNETDNFPTKDKKKITEAYNNCKQ